MVEKGDHLAFEVKWPILWLLIASSHYRTEILYHTALFFKPGKLHLVLVANITRRLWIVSCSQEKDTGTLFVHFQVTLSGDSY